ncbi:hypothetical protein K9O30_19795 [Clostridium bowmanii]|uniref:hypothetical protein n=1 Tax=Clostridium bowmanii TaxID=132925 RepID=UPI001C0CE99E|nr:hypothetical protein [Clostridium bowmanii]MBU3191603.1 hypothetical protein [Clostridium bowmanii]MCA1075923.1 hypothetical protein [Clostridium bowmanii]
MEVINQSRVDFHYRVSPSGPIICNTIFSNIVKTVIMENSVVAVKKVDKSTACIFDILTYSICIINKSMYCVSNIFFRDLVPSVEKFICSSVEVNRIRNKKLDPNCGFYVGTLEAFSTCLITFKVLVLQHTICMKIKNHAYITYDYIYNLEKAPIRVTIKTNVTFTTVENRLFKQINISNEFKMCNSCVHNKNIVNISTKVNVMKTKILTTPKGISEEGVYLSGYKILIMGVVEYSIAYINKKYSRICCKKFISGFSTSLVVPEGIYYSNKPDFHITIESTVITPLKTRGFKVDSTILISLI